MSSLEWLFGLEQFGVKLGLANITTIVEALGHPERAFRAVHVAGTNGKGSVSAMVDTGLRAAGHRTGRYTSPHLVRLAERFTIDGAPVDDTALGEAADRLRHLVDRLRREGRLDACPTFFEVTTAMAFDLFRQSAVTTAVVEVGLGGRLDATNVLTPALTAITTIGVDHQEHLGHAVAEIAAEKAGIVKAGIPVVVGTLPPAAEAVVRGAARACRAPYIAAHEGVRAEGVQPLREDSVIARLTTPVHQYTNVRVGLAGAHQVDNAIVAVRLLEALDAAGIPVPAAAITSGLASVSWPGRLERRQLPDGREALLDAAHNLDGAAALATFLATEGAGRRPLVFAAMRDKDIRGMLEMLAPHVSAVVATCASYRRSADPSEIAALARAILTDMPVTTEPSAATALAAAWRQSPRILVAGSIFLLGDVMRELERP